MRPERVFRPGLDPVLDPRDLGPVVMVGRRLRRRTGAAPAGAARVGNRFGSPKGPGSTVSSQYFSSKFERSSRFRAVVWAPTAPSARLVIERPSRILTKILFAGTVFPGPLSSASRLHTVAPTGREGKPPNPSLPARGACRLSHALPALNSSINGAVPIFASFCVEARAFGARFLYPRFARGSFLPRPSGSGFIVIDSR